MRASAINRRQFLVSSAAAVGFALAGAARAQATDSKRGGEFSEFLEAVPALMEREGVPGLQIALVREGGVALFRSFGVSNIETKTPVDAETVFEAASLSKPVFAYLVMKLVEEGLLDVDTPLHKILVPPAAGPPELIEALTPKLILSHTTGFPNWYAGKSPLFIRSSQGRLFAYSGMAYEYLQKVVEKLAGEGLDALLQRRVFAPLSMGSASMVWREDYETRLAHGHKTGDDTKPEREMMKVAGAASSLVCNAEDYARFVAALVKPPDANETFLKTETIAQMFTPRIDAGPEVSWGLGWGLQLAKSGPVSFFQWGNNGDIYNAFVVGCPSTGEGAVVFTNSGKGLRVCRDLVPMAVSGDHPALRWNRVVGN